MKIALNFELALVSALLTLGLVGCSKPGPAETTGKKIDQMNESASAAAAESVNKANDMAAKQPETTGQKIDDAEITVKVKAALLYEDDLRSMKINVDTSQGIVTLEGTANSQENKEKAIRVSAAVKGVRSVISKLTVEPKKDRY
jgi:hyperosmotically inducible protein